MRKALKFYLVASTIISSTLMGSMAFAVGEEYLENLDKRGLKIALKGVICKYDLSMKEFREPDSLSLNRHRRDIVVGFLREVLARKLFQYQERMRLLPGNSDHPDYQALNAKYRKFYDKEEEITSAWSNSFLDQMQEVASSSSSNQQSSWYQEYGIEEFDEKTLKVAIQVILNEKSKDDIYSDLLSPEDAERKEKVENLLKRLSQKKESLSLERKQRKISNKIQELEKTFHNLYMQVSYIEDGINKAQAQREQEMNELEKKKHVLPKKIATEEMLKELEGLDKLFLTQIREDHEASRRHDKGIIEPHASLDEAMGIYAESVMSITKVMKENGYVMELIERVFKLFQGEGPVDFGAASKKITEKAKELHFPQIGAHFVGDHSYFPFFERLTSLFCQLVDDPTDLVYSQGPACKNGLYGRIVFNTLIALKEKLSEGIKNPSQLPETFFEDPRNADVIKNVMRQIQEEDYASQEEYMRICQKAKEDKGNIEELIVAKKVELEKLHGELISTRNPYENYWKEFLPKMGDSFREYNHSSLSNDAILKVLFPGLREGEIPPLEVAKAKFSELAKAGRPYAKLFTPSEG